MIHENPTLYLKEKKDNEQLNKEVKFPIDISDKNTSSKKTYICKEGEIEFYKNEDKQVIISKFGIAFLGF